ncbi:MAG TPA: PAS domain-containing sensor histidine kinase [Longimicrobium sp.]|nr:PAS domain-containing sensor histidine kinase [Longimicrobium sp.]
MKSVTEVAVSTHVPALEALADGFLTVDGEWRVTYWNGAAERWLGIAREDALGRPLWDALPGAPEAELRSALAVLRAGDPPLRLPFAAPGERTLSLEATAMEGGGLAVQMRDATDQTRMGERYTHLLESIRDGFIAVDSGWRIVYLNPAAEALLSVRPRRALGAPLLAFLPEDPPELRAALHATFRDGEPRRLLAVRPEGRLFRGRRFDVWTHPLAEGGLSLLFQDVTERQERESELARLAAEAEEASRAKSRFFAAVSHELRTPLHAIVGYTHLLSTDSYGEMPSPAVRAAERASVCAEHLARLIDDVLLLTTTEIGRLPVYPSPLALGPFLAEILQPLELQAGAKSLEFALELPDEPPTMETDPERLRQLLYALVTNAVKFTSRGRVTVRARSVEARERLVSLRPGAFEPRLMPAVELEVADTGPGIAPEDRARIFEAFEQVCDDARTDSLNRGTGLGLSIARQLTRLLGGTLEVESEPGAGTVFRLRLPVAYGHAIS